MSPNKFEELLALVAPLITKEYKGREPIRPNFRNLELLVAVVVRYLSPAQSAESLPQQESFHTFQNLAKYNNY